MAARMVTKMATMVAKGLMLSNNWPMSQGRLMAPILAPKKNQPVVNPVMVIRRAASDMVTGKTEAIERPIPMAPTQRASGESGQRMMIPRQISQPARSPIRMSEGLARTDIGMASNRPRVSAPQNAEVR